jgi:2-deoxy-D-gluconate 3-dehydrogenase
VPGYAAARRHAVDQGLANEWPRGLNVNAIAPLTSLRNARPLGRTSSTETDHRLDSCRAVGKPEDPGKNVLAPAASDYVNGHVLVVDGGWMAR